MLKVCFCNTLSGCIDESTSQLYLRELPEPVFRFPLTERLQHSDERGKHPFSFCLLLLNEISRGECCERFSGASLEAASTTTRSPGNLTIFGGTLGQSELEKPV